MKEKTLSENQWTGINDTPKEKTLSDEILENQQFPEGVIASKKVKQFIKRLKEKMCLESPNVCNECIFCREINEEFGEKLT